MVIRLLGAVFEVAILHPDRTCPKEFSLDELKEYGHHIHHLLLYDWNGCPTQTEYLTFCPNVVNLALWTGSYSNNTIQELSHLPLKRLSIDLSQFSESVTGTYIITPELITVFSNITHLDVASMISMWDDCEALAHFRVLTHLALFSGTDVNTFHQILEKVEGLKIIIWLSGSELGIKETPESFPEQIQDDRVVALECCYIKDWEAGARGEEDMWAVAEKIVEARRAQNLA